MSGEMRITIDTWFSKFLSSVFLQSVVCVWWCHGDSAWKILWGCWCSVFFQWEDRRRWHGLRFVRYCCIYKVCFLLGFDCVFLFRFWDYEILCGNVWCVFSRIRVSVDRSCIVVVLGLFADIRQVYFRCRLLSIGWCERSISCEIVVEVLPFMS